MAKRTFQVANLSFATATALGSAATSGQYMAIKGGSSTQFIDILEVMVQGLSAASAVFGGLLARVSTVETGAQTALTSPNSDGPNNPATAALAAPPQTFIAAATTQPTPSSAASDTKLPVSINAFGGALRWNAAPTQQWSQVGNTATLGESILFNSTSAGGQSSNCNVSIIYEPA